MEVGDTVIYCTPRGNHEATIVSISDEETITLEYQNKGRTVRAEHATHTPGLTGYCWCTKKELEAKTKEETKKLKEEKADLEKKIKSIDTAEANEDAQDDNPENETSD